MFPPDGMKGTPEEIRAWCRQQEIENGIEELCRNWREVFVPRMLPGFAKNVIAPALVEIYLKEREERRAKKEVEIKMASRKSKEARKKDLDRKT